MTTAIPWHRDDLPYLTVPQMIEVDRAMVEDFRIDLVRMMENAGRTLAHLGRVRFFEGDPRRRKAVVLAGTGGNGGGALVCARRLHAWGAEKYVGELYLADIGVPPSLYGGTALGFSVGPLFAESDLLRLR
jgi:NAD(P)H-hydrate epimerase